jgi:hypothetical protein
MINWESLLTSYPPSKIEVCESKAKEGTGFVFGFGVCRPAEGGGAGPHAPRKIHRS